MCKVRYLFSTKNTFDKDDLEKDIKKVYKNVCVKNSKDNDWVIELEIPEVLYNVSTNFHIGAFMQKHCSLKSNVNIQCSKN